MENHHQQAWGVTGPAAAPPPPPVGVAEPASFLQEEEDEFERLFTELLYASHSRAAAKMAAQEGDEEEEGAGQHHRELPPPPPPSQYPSLKRCRSSPAGGSGAGRGDEEEDDVESYTVQSYTGAEQLAHGGDGYDTACSLEAQGVLEASGGEDEARCVVEPDTEQDTAVCYYWDRVPRGGGGGDGEEEYYSNLYHQYHRYSDGSLSSSDGELRYSSYGAGGLPVLRVEESEDDSEEDREGEHSLTDSMERLTGLRRRNRPSHQQLEAFRKAHSFQEGDSGTGSRDASVPSSEARRAAMRGRHSEGSFGSPSVTATLGGSDTGDKLFFDLLDDLDNITGNTPSMKRRQRARDMFSDWLFSEKAKASSKGAGSGGDEKKKNRKSFHEFMSYRDEDGQQDGGSRDGGQDSGPERLSRAGSEPSEGKHAGNGAGSNNNSSNGTSAGFGNYNFKPLQRREDGLSLSEQDALLERRIKAEYLATQASATGSRSPSAINATGCRSPSAVTGTGSPLMKRKGPQLSAARDPNSPARSSPTSPVVKSTKKLPTVSTPSPKPVPQHPKSPPQTSPTPTMTPAKPRLPATAEFCANNAADTLEMLKNVKFRKQKGSKCRVFSEAEAEAKVEQQQQLSHKLLALEVGPRNIYQRWKLKGRPLSFEYLDEKIYSGSTVVYSKRRSLQEARHHGDQSPPPPQPPEDLFTPDTADHTQPQPPPLVPQTAWNTLRQVAPPQPDAETSFNERRSDEYGSIRFDTVRPFTVPEEDDADSGYHTGESTLRGAGGAPSPAPQPPGERTLTREDLKRRIDAFNDNQHGLLMTLRESNNTFQGFIRVYMNLMRPISMSLTARPPSIYDILTPDVNDDPQEYESDTQLTSFYLPKDTTKVIHISSNTTAQEVIRALLQKFRITDNPRKFALYERVDDGTSKSTMRRLRDDECPLPLCLCWTAEGLNFHRFILQENDTGEIMWDAFSVPELDNFLRILDREEEEYVEQVKAKYSLMKLQMTQHLKNLDQRRLPNKDQRTPVFV